MFQSLLVQGSLLDNVYQEIGISSVLMGDVYQVVWGSQEAEFDGCLC